MKLDDNFSSGFFYNDLPLQINIIKRFRDNFLLYEFFFVILQPRMNKIVIHKNATSKNLYRVLGSAVCNSRQWDIATNKQELVAYLTQFQPDLISIGPLSDMTTEEVAMYLRAFYMRLRIKIPTYICNEVEKKDIVKAIMKGKSPLSPVSTRDCTDGKVAAA